MKKIFCLLALFFLISCSSEKPAGVNELKPAGKVGGDIGETASSSGKREYSIEITPREASRKSTFTLRPTGFNLSEAKIEWLVNGSPVAGADGYYFSVGETRKGDIVRAKVIIKGKEIMSNETTIKNSPPEITRAQFLPAGGTLSVDADAGDADGDKVALAYEWTRNGKPAGNDKTLDGPVKKGDKVSVRIIPSDEEGEGRPAILTSEVRNMPPVITQHGDHIYDGRVYSYQVRATDADGNPVTFSLKSSPSGMGINPKTGVITWIVPPDFDGKTSFTVSVTDDHGGETIQTSSVELPVRGNR
jgi:hypothetical protein